MGPDTLYTTLVSNDVRRRREILNRISFDLLWAQELNLSDVRLFAINLDADPELERVLVFRSSGIDGAAIIVKLEDGIWWELGGFLCGGPGSPIVDPFIEPKETVWYGTKDLIVHSGGPHGTGVGERDLSIYRVWKGRLYRVFLIAESAYDLAGGEFSRISYPDVESQTAPRIISVRKVKERGRQRTTECLTYRWDAVRFEFVQINPNRTVCGSGD